MCAATATLARPAAAARDENPPCELDLALAAFQPISLTEMDGVALLDRRDTKYVVRAADALAAMAEVASAYRVLEIDGRRAHHYRTVYFDTPDLALFRAHHRDEPGRYKVRCRQYIDSRTKLYHAPSRGRESGDASASAGTVAPAKITADLNEALKVIEDFKPTIARNAYLTNPCQARSWQILQTHADFTRQTIAALLLKQEGKSDEAKAAGAALVQSVWDHEPDLQQILDVNAYAGGLRGMFEGRRRRNP